MDRHPSETYFQLPPPGYYSIPPQEEKEVHLRDYLKVLRKRMWIIIAVIFIAVIVTALKTFPARPVYRGTATIQINIENPRILDFKEIFTINAWAMDYYKTQHKILESRSLARRVIQTLKLSDHPEFLPQPPTPFQKWKSDVLASLSHLFDSFNLFSSRIKKPPIGKDTSTDGDLSENERDTPLIGHFLSRVIIEPVKDCRLIKIQFDSHYPDLAGQVPNVLAKEYIQLNLESRVNVTEQAKEWLGEQLEDLKAKVERAEEVLQEFGSKHDIIFLNDKENVAMKRLEELNEALTKAESERMAKEAIYKQIKQDKGQMIDALPSILENKLIQELKQTSIQLEAQYMRLSETFKPNYPEMVRLKNQMEAIQKRLNVEISKSIASIKNEYESNLRRESLLRVAFEQQKAKALGVQQNAIQYNILKREADTNKEIYKNLLMRMKEVGVAASLNPSNIQLIDQAEVPRAPIRPNRQRSLLMAIVAGLFVGMGLAFFLDYLDNTVKTPEDIEQMIRLPSFGMVPEISHEKRKRVDRRSSHPVELITFRHPKSMLSEAYRSIRTSILLSISEKPPKTIVFSSPNPGEGKTTTLINTAIALSQLGAQVIIIDADMRKPRVHEVFGQGNGTGLSTFLSGHASLASLIKKSDVPNLHYISGGPIPPNPSELLGSNLFKKMLQSLGEKFDQIIIDSPPIIGFTDSIILSASVEGVILVVTGGKTPKGTLKQAKEALMQVNAKILGVVINRINIEGYDYKDYYHRYAYYQSYYGKERKKELPFRSNKKAG